MKRRAWLLAPLLAFPAYAADLKIPLRPGSFQALAEVRINGGLYRFIVDTGASRSAINNETVAALGLNPQSLQTTLAKLADGRTVATQVTRFQNVELGTLKIPFMIATVSGFNLLGMDVLGRYRVILDAPSNELTLEEATKDNLKIFGASASFPYNPRNFSIPIRVQINGTPVNLLLDTGATSTVLSQRIAGALNLTSTGKTQNTRVADGKMVIGREVQIASLGVGTLAVNNSSAIVIDQAIGERGNDGLLGYNFLRNFRLTLDPATGKGYLQQF